VLEALKYLWEEPGLNLDQDGFVVGNSGINTVSHGEEYETHERVYCRRDYDMTTHPQVTKYRAMMILEEQENAKKRREKKEKTQIWQIEKQIKAKTLSWIAVVSLWDRNAGDVWTAFLNSL